VRGAVDRDLERTLHAVADQVADRYA